MWCGVVLNCIVLHYTVSAVLYCIILYCTAQYCIVCVVCCCVVPFRNNSQSGALSTLIYSNIPPQYSSRQFNGGGATLDQVLK